MSVVVVDQSQFIVYVFDQEVEPVLLLSFEVDPEEGFFHAFRCEGGEAGLSRHRTGASAGCGGRPRLIPRLTAKPV